MKDFLKYVLATITGLFLIGVLLTVVGVVSLIGIVATSDTTPKVEDNSVFVLKLNTSIEERVTDNPYSKLLGLTGDDGPIGLDDILASIQKAKEDPKIKGIYLEMDSPAMMPATAQCIRKALTDFRKSGKFILSYASSYSVGSYYVASAANRLLLNHEGVVNWSGMSAQPMYYKNLLDKIGIKMQIFKVGTYKSAVEPFIANEASEANIEQTTSYLSSIWEQMRNDVSTDRHISADSLNSYADRCLIMADPQAYLRLKLIDRLVYSEDIQAELKRCMKIKPTESYHTLYLEDMINLPAKHAHTDSDEIAVYYAYGSVGQMMAESSDIIDEKVVCKDLRSLRDDKHVKAVVLRINTSGGSAYDAEQIWKDLAELSKKKPVVVSMSDVTASAGYYIASAGNYIYAEPTTITGSIGIFGMVPDVSELTENKLGIHVQSIQTNAYGDFGNITRPFTENEKQLMQARINRGYRLFVKRCAEGRNMSTEEIEKIAEGRVWTGRQAKQIGLVDDLGGLEQAIAKARQLAKSKDASVVSYPEKPDLLQNLLNLTKSDSYIDAKMKETFGTYYSEFSSLKHLDKMDYMRASLPYILHLNF